MKRKIIPQIEPWLGKEEIKEYLRKFREAIAQNKLIKKIKQEVLEFSKKFPIPAIS